MPFIACLMCLMMINSYGDHCLTAIIVDRIFIAGARPFGQPQDTLTLSYSDFVFFMLSEEGVCHLMGGGGRLVATFPKRV